MERYSASASSEIQERKEEGKSIIYKKLYRVIHISTNPGDVVLTPSAEVERHLTCVSEKNAIGLELKWKTVTYS